MWDSFAPRWALSLCILGLSVLVSVPAQGAPDGWPGFEEDAPQAKRQRKRVRDRGETTGAKKFAFLVGIGHYGRKYTPKLADGARPWARLYGPETDVQNLTQELHRRGFEVATLINEDATRDGIVRGFLEALYDKVETGRGDTALFYFAGHGQQISDLEGDESDGYDESLVTFDNGGVESRQGRLVDDDLGKMIKLLGTKTKNIVLVFDSCHSGTVSRGALRARGGEKPLGPAKCPAGGCTADTAQSEGDTAGQAILLTAARADQPAFEKDLPYSKEASSAGLLTYNLVTALRALPPGATYDALFARLRASMHSVSGRQDPTLEGDGTKIIFGTARGEKAAGFHVQKAADGYLIAGGMASGLAKGTVLGVFPFSKADAERVAQAPLQIEITEVGATGSQAKVVGDSAVAPALDKAVAEEGGAGFVLQHRFGDRPLRVDVSQAPANYRTNLQDVTGVTFIEDGKAFDFAVRAGQRERGGKTVSVLTLVDAAGDAVPLPACVNQAPLAAVEATDERGWLPIANALEFAERRRRLLAFGAGGGASEVEGRLRVIPLDGEPKTVDGGTRLAPKAKYRIEVTNPGKTPFYPYIVELATDGTVGVLYPQPTKNAEPITHGKTWVWPKSHIAAGTVQGKQQIALLASKAPVVDIRKIALELRPYSCPGTRGSTPPPPEQASPWHLIFQDVTIEGEAATPTRTRGEGQGHHFYYYRDRHKAPKQPPAPAFASPSGRPGSMMDWRAEEPFMWTITKSTGLGVLLGALLGGGVMLAAEEFDNWQIMSISALSGMGIGLGVGVWEVTRRHRTPPQPPSGPFGQQRRSFWVPLVNTAF